MTFSSELNLVIYHPYMSIFFSHRHRIVKDLRLTQISEQPFIASVAILMRPDDHICMIRRALKEGDYWSGHMGFPGGRKDQGDQNLMQTAIRETEEEIGVRLTSSLCIGRLDDLIHPQLQVAGFVFEAPQIESYTLEEAEVASVHWLPMAAFRNPDLRRTRRASYKGQPYDTPEVLIDSCDVWGLSLRFIEDLLTQLGHP